VALLLEIASLLHHALARYYAVLSRVLSVVLIKYVDDGTTNDLTELASVRRWMIIMAYCHA
jgi:hypothetical protein